MAALMSMSEAANWLGLQSPHGAQWLRRYLLAREVETGQVLLKRVGRNPNRPRYRVTVSTLRKHCPELIDRVDDIGRALQAMVIAQKREREEICERLEDIEATLGILTEAVRELRAAGPMRRAS